MCESIADGGQRCATHARPRAARARSRYERAYPRGCRVDPLAQAEASGGWSSSPPPRPQAQARPRPTFAPPPTPASRLAPQPAFWGTPARPAAATRRRPARPGTRLRRRRRRPLSARTVRRIAWRRLKRQVRGLLRSITPKWMRKPLAAIGSGWAIGKTLGKLITGR